MQIAQKNFYKKFLGRVGEKKTAEFLKGKGYKILEKNYRKRSGEIDLIAKDGETIVFIEVKTRADDSFGKPCEAVGKEKQLKYFKVATAYLIEKFNTEEIASRFDVVEIEDGKINHVEDAFSL